MKTRIYLAGPMRGIDKFNFPAFFNAAGRLRECGHLVQSPAEHDVEIGFDYTQNSLEGFDLKASLMWDFKTVMDSEAVVVLPGYENSSGVAAEMAVAKACGIPVYAYTSTSYSWPPTTDRAWGKKEYFMPLDEEDVVDPRRIEELLKPREVEALNLTVGPVEVVITEGEEIRYTDPTTGGQKGTKLARFDLLPWRALWKLAEHYGVGAQKYEDRNWEKGYSWSLSAAALGRHLASYLSGDRIDQETGHSHMVAVAWHALCLLTFEETHPELDDLPCASS